MHEKAQFWAWYDFAVAWLLECGYVWLGDRFDKQNKQKWAFRFVWSNQAEASRKMNALVHHLWWGYGANNAWQHSS